MEKLSPSFGATLENLTSFAHETLRETPCTAAPVFIKAAPRGDEGVMSDVPCRYAAPINFTQ